MRVTRYDSKYDSNQIQLIKDLRREGASYREISHVTKMPLPTVGYYVHDIEAAKDGQRTIWVKADTAVAICQPGTPLQELPLPNWVLTFLKVKVTKED